MIFSHFLESGRKSRGAPCPGPGPGLGLSPRPGPGRGPIPIDGAGGRPLPTGAPCARDRGRRRVPSGPSNSGHAQGACGRGLRSAPSGPSDSANALCPRARGLRCAPRGKAIPGTRRIRALGASDASLGAKQFQERAGSARSGSPVCPLGTKRFRGRAGSARSAPPMRPSGSGPPPDGWDRQHSRPRLYGALPYRSEATKLFTKGRQREMSKI